MSSTNNFSLQHFRIIANLIVSSKEKGSIQLNEKEADAWMRIAVGRYYYYVFLLLRDAFLADPKLSLLIKHNASDHGTIQRVLEKSLPKELSELAGLVRRLRKLRNKADYNTEFGFKIELVTVKLCYDYAERIRDNLDLIRETCSNYVE